MLTRAFHRVEPIPDGLIDDLRWLAGVLGQVRDLDVLGEAVAQAITHLDPADRRHTNALTKRLDRQRDVALANAHGALDTPRYYALVGRLVDLAVRPPLLAVAQGPAVSVLGAHARQAWRRLDKAARAAGEPGVPIEVVHALRIRAKQFRYAVDALVDVQPAAKAHAALLAVLQDGLGELNDAAVAEAWLRDQCAHQDDPARAFVLGQLVMTERMIIEARRAAWPSAWKPVRRRRRRAWLERSSPARPR